MFPTMQNFSKNNSLPTQENMYYFNFHRSFYYYGAGYFAWKKTIYEILLPRKNVNSYQVFV